MTRPAIRRCGPARPALALLACLGAAGCAEFGLQPVLPPPALAGQASARPPADARGVISYPNYQVAVARGGDTPAAVAQRVGLPAAELAQYNGLPEGVELRQGEVLALPRRVAEAGPAAAGAGVPAAGAIDITTLAGAAIDRATPAAAPAPARAAGPEPTRHRVVRGETAYSVARLYDVSVRALAEWNGLGPDLGVREGQILIIPTGAAAPAPAVDAAPPGTGSVAPAPPSAAAPLPPAEPVAPPVAVAAPDLSESPAETGGGGGRLAAPVPGAVVRAF